ncbi:MAG: Gfo/Idh/MocA family protein, partial [Gemmatimonadales bacterium]
MPETSRREFLATSGAAALGTRIGADAWRASRPVPVFAAPTPLRAAEPLRIGVIGTGGMGTGHVEAFLRLATAGADVQVAALADVCRPRLDAAKAKVEEAQGTGSVTTYYADYPALLARKDLHGVVIASPEHWHAKMAEDAMAAGKAVYVEKPM